jgi:hypothetical protein
MGKLKPGATYIYERDGKTVYARELGADPSTRQVIGWDYDPKAPNTEGYRTWSKKFADEYLWNEIMEAANTNPTLQQALERVKLIYHLSKEEDGNSKT